MPQNRKKFDWPKKIIHIDMDAFYAAIEQRDHPELRGKPVVVGGNPQGRGVVSTASYEARRFGIRSAMPAAQAKRLCPQAIFLRPRFEQYQKDSQSIMAILRRYTDLVESVSLDEAYLDVTHPKLAIADPVLIASMLKQNIHAVTRLTASAGVAPNMFLAKIASDMKKPDGLVVIQPAEVDDFLKNLPVKKIPGVGPVTEKTLHRYKLFTCGDLAGAGELFLREKLGKFGSELYRKSLGLDHREVEPYTESKQYSAEETFEKDSRNLPWMEAKLKELAAEVFLGLKEQARMARTIVLKVKYHDFEQITRSKTIQHDPLSSEEIAKVACDLLKEKTQAGKKAVRLLGLGLNGLKPLSEVKTLQKDLFEESGFKSS